MSEAAPKTDAAPEAADEPSYDAAREELVQVVKRLEAGGTSLAESLQLWERGEKLAGICQHWLDGARERIEQARSAHDSTDGSASEDADQ